MRNIRPIRNEKDYEWALAEVARYFDKEPARGTPDGDRFEVLLGLIDAYETRHWSIEAPDPVDTIKAHMAQSGRSQADLSALIGSRPRATEILKRRRPLTMSMIRKLSSDWQIPAEVLIRPYPLDTGDKKRV